MKKNNHRTIYAPLPTLFTFTSFLLLLLLTACGPKSTVSLETAGAPQPVVNLPAEEPAASPPEMGNVAELAQEAEIIPDQAEELEPEVTVEAPEVIADEPLTAQEEEILKSGPEITYLLDVRETKDFLYYYNFYTATDSKGNPRTGRKAMIRWLKRAEAYMPYVRQVFRERGIAEDLILLPFAESGYNPYAYSRAGAAGMWQFMPYTGKKYGLKVDWWVDERRNPYKATVAAADYLTDLYGMFDDWYLALAAYNAGEGRVARAIKKSGENDYFKIASSRKYLHKETRQYVPKILAIIKIFQNLEELGFEPFNWDAAPELAEVKVKGGTDLLGLAQAAGMNWDAFRELNPALRRNVSPPDDEITIWLPAATTAPAETYLAKSSSRPYAGYSRYKVRNGDSWWRISSRYGVPVSVLKRVNSRRSNLLRPGEYVMIPASGSSRPITYAQAATVSRPEGSFIYRVRRGDSLWEIATKYGVSVASLKSANSLSSNLLRVGQNLTIPAEGPANPGMGGGSSKAVAQSRPTTSYTVRSGDNLWDIATRHGVSVASIKAASNLSSNLLRVGQKLTIPGTGPASSASTPSTPIEQTRTIAERRANYTVHSGDNLWDLSRRFGVSVSTLKQANGLRSNNLQVGQKLYVPDNGGAKTHLAQAQAQNVRQEITYRVRQGDSFWSIARRYNVSLNELLAWNNLTKRSVLHPGDTLKLYR